jgi:hypothetical protein
LCNFKPKIYPIDQFKGNPVLVNNLERLFLRGSDKSYNLYHYVYENILSKLGYDGFHNILEIGLGTNNPELISTMGMYGTPGASIRAFRDALPNSHIFGADIDRNILFQENRVSTTYVDQLDMCTFDELSKTFGDVKYNLIVDDGLHCVGANVNTVIFGLKHLSSNGWIVVEDISLQHVTNWSVIDHILSSIPNLETFLVRARSGFMYVIHKISD